MYIHKLLLVEVHTCRRYFGRYLAELVLLILFTPWYILSLENYSDSINNFDMLHLFAKSIVCPIETHFWKSGRLQFILDNTRIQNCQSLFLSKRKWNNIYQIQALWLHPREESFWNRSMWFFALGRRFQKWLFSKDELQEIETGLNFFCAPLRCRRTTTPLQPPRVHCSVFTVPWVRSKVNSLMKIKG